MADEDDNVEDEDVLSPKRTYQSVQLDVANGIARITLNRPPANVLSIDLMEELNAALESLEYERGVKLLVLMGGAKYFSAGFEVADHLGDRAYVMHESFGRVFENMVNLDKPLLGVVAGSALGAGCILAAGCDIVLAGASAKFGHPEMKGGVFNPVAAVLLPRLVGRKRAAELFLLGASLTAADAERIGLISRVVPDDKLEAEAAVLIQRFQEGSAPVFQSARKAMAGALDLPFTDALRFAEDVYLNQLMASEDAEEGLKAVMEKRKPVWKDQ